MILIESGFLLKNDVSCNFMLKFYIIILFRQIAKILGQFFNFYLFLILNENFKISTLALFNYLTNRNSFEVLLLDNVLINGIYRKNYKYHVR